MRLNIWKMKPMWSALKRSRSAPPSAPRCAAQNLYRSFARRDDSGHKTEKRGLAAAARALQEYTLPARDAQRFNVDYRLAATLPREPHIRQRYDTV